VHLFFMGLEFALSSAHLTAARILKCALKRECTFYRDAGFCSIKYAFAFTRYAPITCAFSGCFKLIIAQKKSEVLPIRLRLAQIKLEYLFSSNFPELQVLDLPPVAHLYFPWNGIRVFHHYFPQLFSTWKQPFYGKWLTVYMSRSLPYRINTGRLTISILLPTHWVIMLSYLWS
jgi:hypothetical protein